MSETKGYLIAGKWKTSSDTFEVKSPFDGEVVATVAAPDADDVEAATAAAAGIFDETRKLPLHVRADALSHISARLEERGDEIAELIAREGGKPLKWAKVEAARAVSTFRWAGAGYGRVAPAGSSVSHCHCQWFKARNRLVCNSPPANQRRHGRRSFRGP